MAVIVNGKTVVYAGSGGILVTQDVCLTGDDKVPVTYNNVAKSADAANTDSGVLINGNPICTVNSYFSKSIGDEAGDHKGIHSGTIQGKAEFITASPDVLVNGIPVVRQGDLMISNNRNTSPEQLQQPGINWGDDADDEELVKLVENPQPNQINIDISGTDVATTLHGKICAGDKFHYVMAGDSGKDNGVLKRLAIANVKSGKFALYYQLADMQGGYLNIPLGSNVPSQPSDAEQSEIGQAENILVVVTPRWHNIKPNALNPPVKNYQSIASFDPAYRDFIAQELDEYHQKNSQEKPWPEMISPTLKSLLQKELQPSHALILNPGWLYIYSQVVGEQNYTLWREIELLPEGKLRDVNLENNQGKEERAATSEENTQLIFPHKINNQQNKFCLAYSQVQWSWERIKYFEDSVNQMELNKRFDFLDLAHFVEPTEENYLFVSDPIGLVNNLQQDLTAAWLELKDLMAKTKDSPEFKSALLTYQIFYNPNYAFNQGMSDTEAIDSKVALAHGMTPNELTEPNENKKCQQDLDQAKLENILQVKERKALRIRIRYLQQALIELMQQDDFTTAFIDFFAASIAYYPNSFSALAGLLTFTSSDPATLDQNLDVATDYDSNQMLPGQNYFFDLFNAEHPFYNKLFPTEQKLADGAGVFNQEKFAATLELHDALSEAMAMAIKSLLHVQALTIKHLSSAVINKMQETLLTLAHATNNEYLTAVELVNPADMAENSDIIGYDNQILDRFVTKMNQRDETKAGAIEVLQRKISVNNGNFNYDHAETIATTHTSEHAYKDFRGVKNTETITATAVRKNILKLFEKTNTKVLVHKEIEQGLISADKIASPIFLGLQMVNVANAVKEALENPGAKTEIKAVGSALMIIFAIEQTAKAFAEEKEYYKYFTENKNVIIRGYMKVAGLAKLKLTPLGLAGIAANTISTYLVFEDLTKTWYQHDTGANLGEIIQITGFTLNNASIIGEAWALFAENQTWLAIFGVVGWIAATTILLGTIIYTYCKDDDLTKYAKNCPFSINSSSMTAEQSYAELMTILTSPTIFLRKVPSSDGYQQLSAEIKTPYFIPENSSLDVRLTKAKNLIKQSISATGANPRLFEGEQSSLPPYQIEQLIDQANNRIVGFKLYYQQQIGSEELALFTHYDFTYAGKLRLFLNNKKYRIPTPVLYKEDEKPELAAEDSDIVTNTDADPTWIYSNHLSISYRKNQYGNYS